MAPDHVPLTDEELSEIEESWEDAGRPIPGGRVFASKELAMAADLDCHVWSVDRWVVQGTP